MTTKLQFHSRQPTARGRLGCSRSDRPRARDRRSELGASASQADVGSVYFDASDNAAAGQTLFNGTFTGSDNVGLGRTVMPTLTNGFTTSPSVRGADANTTGFSNVATGHAALELQHRPAPTMSPPGTSRLAQHHRLLQRRRPAPSTTDRAARHDRRPQRRHRLQRALQTTRPATTTSPTGIRHAGAQHDRRQQRRNRLRGAGREHAPATTTSPPASNALLATPPAARTSPSARDAGENLTTGSNNIDIANVGVAGESGTIRIGTDGNQTAAFIAGISGTTPAERPSRWSSTSNGRLGTAPASSASARRSRRPSSGSPPS